MYRTISAVILTATASALAAQGVTPVLPAFDPAAFATAGENAYFPLVPGTTRHSASAPDTQGVSAEGNVVTVMGEGPEILGVATVAVLDEAFEDGILVERTFDYVAADAAGNIWYFGEDVTNFYYDDAGRLLSTDSESAWKAGVNGAAPGILVPAEWAPGLALFQEHAPGEEAMDWFEVVATDLRIEVSAGVFDGVVQVHEASMADPGPGEFKYYAPGMGLIREDEGLSADGGPPEVVIELLR